MMKGWNNSSLGMYVDNGILFACTEEWGDVAQVLTARYMVCEEWLQRSCHGSAGTPLRTHAGAEALGLQDARTAICT
jgi:hypothetical protein